MSTLEEISQQIPKGKTVVFISGAFNVIHPGNVRLMNFAKEVADFVVIGVFPDSEPGTIITQEQRISAIKAISIVDAVFLIETSIEYVLEQLKPNIVLKGKEHEVLFNIEKSAVEKYGGRLIFGSGDARFSSIELIRHELSNERVANITTPLGFCERHQLNPNNLKKIIEKIMGLNVIVVGDLILDEYISCEALGMSQEDPTLVVSPITESTYLGGAGIVAAHARGMGANVEFFSISGNDKGASVAEQKLTTCGVSLNVYMDETRPTTFKKRYRVGDKTMLRVNNLRRHEISEDLIKGIIKVFERRISNADLVIFSDFNYGCLPQSLVDRLTQLAKKKNIMVCADSQASSQFGNISRFQNMNLITPTEREARLATQDFSSGLAELAGKVREKSNAKHVLMTLASEGLLIETSTVSVKNLKTDRIEALNDNPKDVAGGGDSVLVVSSLCVAAGASIWEAAYLGSVAAAIQVGRLGNTPLSFEEILKEIIK